MLNAMLHLVRCELLLNDGTKFLEVSAQVCNQLGVVLTLTIELLQIPVAVCDQLGIVLTSSVSSGVPLLPLL